MTLLSLHASQENEKKKVLNLIVATRISSYEHEMCMSNCTITLVYHAESVHGRAHLHALERSICTLHVYQ